MKKTISQITRSLLIDSGVFGFSRQVSEHRLAFDFGGKTYAVTTDAKTGIPRTDEYFAAVDVAFEKWRQGLTPRDAFAKAAKKYGEWYAGWKSPHGRPFPDHYFDAADDEARRIMKEFGIV